MGGNLAIRWLNHHRQYPDKRERGTGRALGPGTGENPFYVPPPYKAGEATSERGILIKNKGKKVHKEKKANMYLKNDITNRFLS